MAATVAVIADIVKTVSSGQALLQSIRNKGPGPDFYTMRIEIGDNKDAAGNPPSVIFTDFSETQFFGVFEGTSKKPNDQCRNNKDLPISFFDSPDLSLFKGLKNGEAPIRSFKTTNGYNLKTIDIQPGKNAICVSNMIIKGSDTQARRDEIFLPIGDLGFLCGKEWNWGTILNGTRQRCVWLDGQPDNGAKPMQSLRLNMEEISGFFNSDKGNELKSLDLKKACELFTDNAGTIPNRNECSTVSSKRDIQSKKVVIDAVPLIEVASTDFTDKKNAASTDGFVGAGFVTSDNKIFNSETKEFVDVTIIPDAPKTLAPEKDENEGEPPAEDKAANATTTKDAPETASEKPKLKSRHFLKKLKEIKREKQFRKRESLANLVQVLKCQATVNGDTPDCEVAETIDTSSAK